MTLKEYSVYNQKYRSLEGLHVEPSLESVIELQEAVMNAMQAQRDLAQIWDEQTQARIARQRTLAKLPRHAG